MKQIKFSPPDIGEDEINEVVNTLRSGWITTGPKTKLLEKQMADFCGTSKFVCLNSATGALELTLRLLGIGPGDEVITSAYTYTASASVICHVGATPVLADTYPGSFEISAESIEKAVTGKTKAIITVDIGGVICDYSRIIDIIKSKPFYANNSIQEAIGRIVVIADAAHSFGSVRNGVKSGRHADFSCFSFHAVKNLAMGEGGGVTWNKVEGISDDEIYSQFMLLSLHGQSKDALSKSAAGKWEYDILMCGYKYNLTDIMASIGIAQLKRFPTLLKRRCEIAYIYDSIINKQKAEPLAHEGKDFVSNRHLYIARIINKDEAYRNDVIEKLAVRGIPANVHFKPLPMFTAYKNMGFNISDFPNSYNMYECAVSLPIHTLLDDEQAAYIAESFNDII